MDARAASRQAEQLSAPPKGGTSVSHHLDTPLAAQTGQLYLDDLYVFPGGGRAQADNDPEAMLSLVAGMAVPSGRRPSGTAGQRASDFPYVVPA
jgi:hypothetical protein